MTCSCLHFPAHDSDVAQYGLGAAARRYQNRGYAVLPLVRGGKRPHRMLPYGGSGSDGVYHATHSQLCTDSWWGGDPAANVGVATGQISRLVVIDLDVKQHDGPAVFWRFLFENNLGEMPGVPTSRTPSGGLHLWLRTPAGVAVPDRPGILPGVDVRGDGGLVVAPPSMLLHSPIDRPGEQRSDGEQVPVAYAWSAGCPCVVPDAPPWLLPWLASAPPQTGRDAAGQPGQDHQPDLAGLIRNGIPRGQRNSEMYRTACSLYRKHGTDTEAAVTVKEILTQIWRAGDRTDFGMREVLTIADGARRFIQGEQGKEQQIVRSYVQWMSRGGSAGVNRE